MYLFELLYLNMLRSCPWHNFETIGLMDYHQMLYNDSQEL